MNFYLNVFQRNCFPAVLAKKNIWSNILSENQLFFDTGKLGAYLCLIFSLLRFSFIVLFIFCNVKPNGRSLTSVQLESDAAYIIIMLLMSTSNGYLGSMCMISAPQVTNIYSALDSFRLTPYIISSALLQWRGSPDGIQSNGGSSRTRTWNGSFSQ